jgi:hypothetical protein
MQKSLRLLSFSACLLVFCASLAAQARFGLKAGINAANLQYSQDYANFFESITGDALLPKPVPTFTLGAHADIGLSRHLDLSLGLQLVGKGSKITYTNGILGFGTDQTDVTQAYFLQIPLALSYHTSGLHVGAGPFVGYALWGQRKSTTESGGTKTVRTTQLEFGNESNDDASPLDYGLQFEAGYDLGPVRLSLAYNQGLANLFNKQFVDDADDLDQDFRMRSAALGLSLTYLF